MSDNLWGFPIKPAKDGACTDASEMKLGTWADLANVRVWGYNTLTWGRYGPMLVNRHDQYVGRSFVAYGEFSEHEVAYLRTLVPEGGVVVDVGANIGALTIPLAQHVGLTGRVIAFEPQRYVHQLLVANVALHSLPHVEVLRAGVGATTGQVTVPVVRPDLPEGAEFNYGGVALNQGTPGEAVPCLPIDALKLARCDLLKVDVEGMECDVVRGALATIARCKPVLYLEADRREQLPELLSLVEGVGYVAFWHAPPLYNDDNHAENADNVFPFIASLNWLCVPADRAGEVVTLQPVTREEVGG